MYEILMENRRENNGWGTLLGHGSFFIAVIIAILFSQVLFFFNNLSDKSYVYFFIACEVLLFLGAGLIVRAKIPVYRSGRFFTFGLKSVPNNLQGCYRWGWGIFLFGVALQLCLLLSK